MPSAFIKLYGAQVFEEFDSLQSDHLFVYASDLASEKMCDSSFQVYDAQLYFLVSMRIRYLRSTMWLYKLFFLICRISLRSFGYGS